MLQQWLAYFYIYSLVGWVWETVYVSLRERTWVNRGFLHGPFLPLYGSGALVLLLVTLPVAHSLPLVYLVGLLTATGLELATGWCMERLFCVRYWDYSRHRLQVHGYIWLGASLFWGVLAVLLVGWVHTPVAALVDAVPLPLLVPAELALSALFLTDLTLSVREALALRALLLRAQQLHAQLQQLRAELEHRQAAHVHALAERRTRVEQQLQTRRSQLSAHREESTEQLLTRLHTLRQHQQRQLQTIRTRCHGLYRRHPSLHLGKLEAILRQEHHHSTGEEGK